MRKPTDEKLVAYLDGELPGTERDQIAVQLDEDAALRQHAAALGEGARLLRAAFDEVLHEPLPDRLIAAARGPAGATVVRFGGRLRQRLGDRRWWAGVAAAASLTGLVIGGGLGYFAADQKADEAEAAAVKLASGNWLDNLAGYHKLFVAAGANDAALADVPANDSQARKVTQKLPADFRLPNLKPWGLQFQGARFIFVDGRPATQLFYTTDNKALGPLTVVVGTSKQPDIAPTFDHRDDVNLLYWRHHGHAYALVGTADIGYLWNIANDIAWQLDAI